MLLFHRLKNSLSLIEKSVDNERSITQKNKKKKATRVGFSHLFIGFKTGSFPFTIEGQKVAFFLIRYEPVLMAKQGINLS